MSTYFMRSSSFLKYIYPELLVLIVMSQPALGLNCQLAFNLMQHFKKSWYLIILFWSPFTGMSGLLRYNKFILFYKEYMVWKHKSKGIFRYSNVIPLYVLLKRLSSIQHTKTKCMKWSGSMLLQPVHCGPCGGWRPLN